MQLQPSSNHKRSILAVFRRGRIEPSSQQQHAPWPTNARIEPHSIPLIPVYRKKARKKNARSMTSKKERSRKCSYAPIADRCSHRRASEKEEDSILGVYLRIGRRFQATCREVLSSPSSVVASIAEFPTNRSSRIRGRVSAISCVKVCHVIRNLLARAG